MDTSHQLLLCPLVPRQYRGEAQSAIHKHLKQALVLVQCNASDGGSLREWGVYTAIISGEKKGVVGISEKKAIEYNIVLALVTKFLS